MPTKLIKHITSEFGWLSFFPVWVFISLLVGIIGYRAFNPTPEKEVTEPIEKYWSKTYIVVGDGTKYLRFKYQDGVMEIPSEFTAHSMDRSAIELSAYLPGMISRKQRTRDKSNNYSLVKILLLLNKDSPGKTGSSTWETVQRLKERGSLSKAPRDESLPEYKIYNGPAGSQYLEPILIDLRSHLDEKIAFRCPPNVHSKHTFRHCHAKFAVSDSLTVRYTVDMTHLKSIDSTHAQIIGFIKSLERND